IYYFGKQINQVEGEEWEEDIPVYSYLGFIKHKHSNKSLGVMHDHRCADWTNNCTTDTDGLKEDFWKIIKSVKFDTD
ncbi:hypothetical protein, partial [Clostridium sp.]|uniref:hypothetical protein n=1 Tax=Clostridium sp. TaxID=1506 RepID=UPI002637CA83